jgi:UDP-2,4-diacetamido-2,4,6-trideoxy-beta-L-altropyranose hydrolase
MSDLLLIRADGGVSKGFGHVMRCLALAQGWQLSGGRAVFALAESAPSLESKVRATGIEIVHLDVVPGSAEDAAQTVNLAIERRAAWVVADGYELGDDWQGAIKNSGLQLLLWDDYGHAGYYSADLILNQNLHATEEMYQRREPYTRLLLGARYAQLRSEFLEWRDWKREISPIARKVLVTMGGSDPENVTGEVVQALASLHDVEGVVVAGGSNPNIDQLRSAVAAQSNLQLVVDAPNMPELMAWADMAVSAGGSTCLELAFMGLPAVLVSIAANQEFAVGALGRSGLSIALAPEASGRQNRLTSAVRTLLSTPREEQSAMSDGLRTLVDGRGTERVVRLLQALNVSLRRVSQGDCPLLWQWANEPAVRSCSFSSDPIPWDDHTRWFESKRGNPECIWHIACDARLRPLGQVRIDLAEGKTGTMNFSVAPECRGRGLGVSILCAALDEVFTTTGVRVVRAFVKPGNTASVRSFERAGFKEIGTDPASPEQALQFVFRAEDL